MDAERLWKEFVTLPAESQGQVLDFLAFLRSRRGKSATREAQQRIDWDNDPFIGIWRDRDDMGDSGSWLRNFREREWARNRG